VKGIVLRDISKLYASGSHAVRGLSLAIEPGEFMVLVGPSGCGKSTVLRIIAGLEEPTDGGVDIGGRDMGGVHPRDRDIAMVFQNYALYPHLSVEENLSFALRMRGAPARVRRERVLEAADLLGINPLLQKKPAQLSGGERQRVALGRAITRKPSAFLFDEPLSNLDPDRRVSTRSEIKRIQRELGTTTVYVTHDHEEAMAIGDRIAVMSRGSLEQVGAPDEVYEHPASRFVGTFLGSPAMNILDAALEHGEPSVSVEVVLGGQRVRLTLERERVPPALREAVRCSIGFRPHDAALSEDGAWRGRLLGAEPLGFATDCTIEVGGTPIRVRESRKMNASIGETVSFDVPASAIHIFPIGDEDGPV